MQPERLRELIQIFGDKVRSQQDLQRFIQLYGNEMDNDFMGVISSVIQSTEDKNVANFLMQIRQTLMSLPQFSQEGQASSGFSGAEAEIESENYATERLRKSNPNAAYPRAVANLERARQTGNDRLIYNCAFTLGRAAQEFRPYPKLKEAIQTYKLASEKALAIGNKTGYAGTQNNLGNSYLYLPTKDRGKNLNNAISCYQNALTVYSKESFPYEYAMTQNNLGIAYADLPTVDRGKNLNNAISCYQNALQVRAKNKYPSEYAETQNNLGNAYTRLPTGKWGENLNNAISCYQNSLQIYTENDFPRDFAMTQNNLATAYAQLPTGDRGENLKKTISCCQNALRVRTKDNFPQDHAATQNVLGSAYRILPTFNRLENLKNAISCHQKALQIYTENDFPHFHAGTQSELGNAYADLSLIENQGDNNLNNAIVCYQNALKVITKEDFTWDYAKTQNNLGLAYADLTTGDPVENLKKAIACYKDALRVRTKKDFPRDRAWTQHNLGTAYLRLLTEDRRNNLKKAISFFRKALRVRTEEEFPQEFVNTMFYLAVAYDASDDEQNAYRTCAEAIKVLETRIRAASSPETRRAIAEEKANIYHLMVSLCIRLGKIEEALSYAERGKSRTLVEMLHSAQLEPSENVPEKVREAFLAVRNKLEELRYLREAGETATPRDFETRESYPEPPEKQIKKQSFTQRIRQILPFGKREKEQALPAKEINVNPVPVSYDSPRVEIWKLIDEAQNAYHQLLEQIRSIDPKFAASERVQPISVSEINALIPEKTVFVECFTGHDGTYIFVLDGKSDVKDTYIVLKDLTGEELFNNIVIEKWRRPYDERQKNETAWFNAIETIPRLLAEKFWYAKDEKGKSLDSLITQSGAERIVFIPHSGLHLLPLHLIPLSSENGQLLMDKYDIAYAPSVSMLRFKLNSDKIQDRDSLFAVANPDGSLHCTNYEVTMISEYFEEKNILWHENATKKAILDQAGKADVVHFSCHGSFQFANSLDSSLLLVIKDKAYLSQTQYDEFLKDYPRAEEILQPLVKNEEDMVCIEINEISADQRNKLKEEAYNVLIERYARERLTLKEIFAKLKIPKADAVVLSACETGMVKLESGDEYIGLASGFMYAGSPTVISSLWSVDDLSTSLLMNRWYENVLTNKMGKAVALKEAQQWIRDLTAEKLIEYLEQYSSQDPHIKQMIRYCKRTAKLMPEQKPFAHPYYWGAFTCNGNWK